MSGKKKLNRISESLKPEQEQKKKVRAEKVIKKVKEAGKLCLDLLYPPRCPLCEKILGRHEHFVCRECEKNLPWIREPVCRKCGKPIADDTREYCMDCMKSTHVFDVGRCVFVYEGSMRLSVTRMKFSNRREYLDFYAHAMSVYFQTLPDMFRNRVIVPIPMHPYKRRERGFDQCLLLAEKFAEEAGLNCATHLLTRTRYTRPQKGLDHRERQQNLKDAFHVSDSAEIPCRILLLDDIYTTGTTMDEAAKALRKAGVRDICFLTLCTGRGREEKV